MSVAEPLHPLSSPRSAGRGEEPDPVQAASSWLTRFKQAWRAQSTAGVAELFSLDSHWRDCVALTGDLQTVSGRAHVAAGLTATTVQPGINLHLDQDRTPPRRVVRAGVEVIEAIVAFDAAWGPASGVVRLLTPAAGDPMAWMWHTSLTGLRTRREEAGQESKTGARPAAPVSAHRGDGRDPSVVVVGAGHAGLGVAACLARLGVDTLVLDRLPRVGDVWRRRYDSLVLHNETHLDHLPYLPFPPDAPRFLPRDTIADWLESYSETLDLHVQTGTDLVRGTRHGGTWSLVVRRGGAEHELHPRHLVMAVGTNAVPLVPSEPGLGDFAGTVLHTNQYRSGAAYSGARAVVLGTGSSAHDIAQDLHGHGAQVTMVQRGPTLVISLEQAQNVYAIQAEGLPLADADLLTAATPYPVLVKANQALASSARLADRELLDALTARGFRLDDGAPDSTGFQLKLLRRNGGYYVDVGCSELIAKGEIALLQHSAIDRFVPEGVRLLDGTLLGADLVVAGTGYLRQHDVVRRLLGAGVARRVGPVWGLDAATGEQANMWQRTRQPGLWFTGGGFPQARVYSRFLALQIALVEDGLLSADRR